MLAYMQSSGIASMSNVTTKGEAVIGVWKYGKL